MRRSAWRIVPPFGMAAAFVGTIVVVALVFMWLIADARGSGRMPVIAVFAVVVAAAVLLLVRRMIRRDRSKSPAEPGNVAPR